MYYPQPWALPGPMMVMIPVPEFEAGMLPAVCPRTGQPATTSVRRRFTTTPLWVLLVVLLSLLIGLIVYFAVRKTAQGSVPLSDATAQRVKRRRSVALVLLLAFPALWIARIGIVASSPPRSAANGVAALLFLLGLPALIAGLLAKVAENQALGFKTRVFDDPYGGRWLEMTGVHPNFADALARLAHHRMAMMGMPPGMVPPDTAYPTLPPPGSLLPAMPWPVLVPPGPQSLPPPGPGDPLPI